MGARPVGAVLRPPALHIITVIFSSFIVFFFFFSPPFQILIARRRSGEPDPSFRDQDKQTFGIGSGGLKGSGLCSRRTSVGSAGRDTAQLHAAALAWSHASLFAEGDPPPHPHHHHLLKEQNKSLTGVPAATWLCYHAL